MRLERSNAIIVSANASRTLKRKYSNRKCASTQKCSKLHCFFCPRFRNATNCFVFCHRLRSVQIAVIVLPSTQKCYKLHLFFVLDWKMLQITMFCLSSTQKCSNYNAFLSPIHKSNKLPNPWHVFLLFRVVCRKGVIRADAHRQIWDT